ncbi:MAG TPA: carbamoyltransferase HypF, partial [Candidatus Binatia bacterium]|nr:carbamoyltransferase HypF [Candidatus Binatia bacterium]
MRPIGLKLPSTKRLKLSIHGAVQGVGFRPFVFRLAGELRLKGWVNNSAQGVFIEVEGPPSNLEQFLLRLEKEKPPRSSLHSLEAAWLDTVGYSTFEIRPSETAGPKTTLVLPDIATCADCLREIFDPQDRRHSYPFTNCTNCGPRFSIIEALPYDRGNTSMKHFTMCPQCQAEYDNPLDRRFHAQPNACPVCGPHVELWDRHGNVLAGGAGKGTADPIAAAAAAFRAGRIVAVKGLGGFHLMVAAHDEQAVRRLRELKHREEKPLALMFPSLEAVKANCKVFPAEARLLRSPEAPIVLLLRLHVSRLAPSLAPGNPNLGVMLPYTPLHHLLLSLLDFPVVATSGNLSDEPICTDERDALERLGTIADLFLVHNRPIVRHVDDSVLRLMAGRELVLRRARGYAPLPIRLSAGDDLRSFAAEIKNQKSKIKNRRKPPKPVSSGVVLAVGAHLKNTIALAVGPQVFLSQHLGDLENDRACQAFRGVIADFEKLYEVKPVIVAADAHPDYLSTQFARDLLAQVSSPASSAGFPAPSRAQRHSPVAAPDPAVQSSKFDVQRSEFGPGSTSSSSLHPRLIQVQHHVAHILSC